MLALDPQIEERLLRGAEAEGLTPSAYIEYLLGADQTWKHEIEELALEGLNSGESIDVTPQFWVDTHRKLDEWMATARSR